jgi:hypothetical protein
MSEAKRLLDANGHIINYPPGFHDIVDAARKCVAGRESDGVDRSDMRAIMSSHLANEIAFLFVGLPRR